MATAGHPRLRRPPPGQRISTEPRRYLVFAGAKGGSKGGWEDFHAAYGSLRLASEMAIGLMACGDCIWVHVVDLQAAGGGKIVEEHCQDRRGGASRRGREHG